MALRIILLLVLVFGGVFLLLAPVEYKTAATIIWLAVVLILLGSLIKFHARHTSFTCPKCGHIFKISAVLNAIRPHTMESIYLKCPLCGENGWFKAKELAD